LRYAESTLADYIARYRKPDPKFGKETESGAQCRFSSYNSIEGRPATTTRHGVFASWIIPSIFIKISCATWGESVIRHPPYPVRKPLGLCVHVKGHTVVDPKGRIQVMMRLMGLEISRR
jgi:hypothetical protein